MRVAAFVAILLAACGGGPARTPVGTPAVTVQLSSNELRFDKAKINVPMDVTFAITLENQEVVPHNVIISGQPRPAGSEPFSGPASRTYVFAGLAAGTYTFVCELHPEMKGVLVSGGAAAAR